MKNGFRATLITKGLDILSVRILSLLNEWREHMLIVLNICVIITKCETTYYSTSALNSIRPRAYADSDIKQRTGDTR